MKPPYDITSEVLQFITAISEKIGEVNAAHLVRPRAKLRRENRIKTIQASLEIEGNTLTVEQISGILDGKRILAPEKDILEVKNAVEVYDQIHAFDCYSLKSLCEAHGILMKNLVENPGRLRSTAVGILKDGEIGHLAPPGNRVHGLMTDLFDYLKHDEDPLLIRSCVFHYEFEFIHPFLDGNGRMGRLWQTLILKEYSPVFEFLPVETLVKARQREYYRALETSDSAGNSTDFLLFMLEIIQQSLEDLLKSQRSSLTCHERMDAFLEMIQSNHFTRKDYMHAFRDISSATASRDLKAAVEDGILVKSGDKRTTQYQFVS